MMSGFLEVSIVISAGLLCLSVFLTLARLVIGPGLPDRVVALDMMTVSIVAICGLASIYFAEPAFLDVALALALVGFLATVALARFADRARRARMAEETSDG